MNILLFYNSFSGAYSSLAVFQDEIIKETKDDILFISYCVDDTFEICKNETIDFSLAIGEFDQYFDGKPVYEITKKHHYQWIIDNPLKMSIDSNSKLITYILINKDFVINLRCLNKPLFIPIGYEEACIKDCQKHKKDGIIFCGQIKSFDEFNNYHFLSTLRHDVELFREDYDNGLNKSFEKTFNHYFGKYKINDQKLVFRLLNSYYRAKKRIEVINSIKSYPVYIVGDVQNEMIRNQTNVHLLGKLSYNQIWSMVAEYKFSLNVNPNYHNAIHDRIIRSICCGTIPITEESEWCKEVFRDTIPYYNFISLDIDSEIEKIKDDKYGIAVRELQNIISQFSWGNAINVIKGNYDQDEV